MPLLSEQGDRSFCSARSVPRPGSTKTGGHPHTPRRTLTQYSPGPDGCSQGHWGPAAGLGIGTSINAMVSIVSAHPCIQPTGRKHSEMLETHIQDSEVLFPSSPPSPPSPPHRPPQGSKLSHCASSPDYAPHPSWQTPWIPLNLSSSFLFSSHLLSFGLFLIFFSRLWP